MVKFAESLRSKERPEWAIFYINYEELKEMLYEGIGKAPKITASVDMGKFDFHDYSNRFDVTFYDACKVELDKVNRFCRERVREYNRRFTELREEVEALHEDLGSTEGEKHPLWKRSIRRNSMDAQLRQSFKDFYAELSALSKFKTLNYSGFLKILKKHDNLFNSSTGEQYLRTKVHTSFFHSNKEVEEMMQQTEAIVTTVFEDGSRAKAMKLLHVPQRDDSLNSWTAFKMGLMFGTGIVLFAVFAVSGVIDPSKNGWRVVIRFYRGPATVIMYLCLVGVNVYCWRQRGINHVFIFGLNPRDNLLHHHFWNLAAIFGVLWAVSIVVFLNAKNIGLPVYVSPLALVITQFAFLFNPFPFGFWSSRRWLFKVLFRIFSAPFHRVRFADFWMCDQLSSLIAIVLDYQYIICFYTNPGVFHVMDDLLMDDRVCITFGNSKKCHCDSKRNLYRPIIRGLPPILRTIQCVRRFYDNHLVCPHLVNAFKYTLTVLSVVFSSLQAANPSGMDPKALLYLWIGCSIASSIMSFIWDVKMDWGLGIWKADNRGLRNDLLYPKLWYYRMAVIADFFLRFSWAISLSLTEMGYLQADIMLTISTPLEVFRRFMWNLFRLENEQINNNNAQRATQLQQEISTATIGFTEEQHMKDLLHMMDNEDGVERSRRATFFKPVRHFSVSSTRIIHVPESRSELFTKVSSVDALGNPTEVSSADYNYDHNSYRKSKCWCCSCLSKNS